MRCRRDLGDQFGLSWDNFGRSSSSQNRELTLHFARALWKNGFLDVRTTKQAYSATDGRFLPDRYVIGTCPHCNYANARGDQCENCTRVLDPADLKNPRSAISGAEDIIRSAIPPICFSNNRSSPINLRAWIDSHKNDWPLLVSSIANKWLDEGSAGIAASPATWTARAFRCPTTSPRSKLKGKVFYVWFDAPRSNISPRRKEWAEKTGKPESLERLVAQLPPTSPIGSLHGQGQCAVPHRRSSRP